MFLGFRFKQQYPKTVQTKKQSGHRSALITKEDAFRYVLSAFGLNDIKKPLQRKIAAVSMRFRCVVLVSGLNEDIKQL
jgi:hypothetical protein